MKKGAGIFAEEGYSSEALLRIFRSLGLDHSELERILYGGSRSEQLVELFTLLDDKSKYDFERAAIHLLKKQIYQKKKSNQNTQSSNLH